MTTEEKIKFTSYKWIEKLKDLDQFLSIWYDNMNEAEKK